MLIPRGFAHGYLTLEDDTRQALLVTPLWFIALGLGWLFIGKKRAAELRK